MPTERNAQRIRIQIYMYRHGTTDISISNIDTYSFAIVQHGHFRQLHGHMPNDCYLIYENRIAQRKTCRDPSASNETRRQEWTNLLLANTGPQRTQESRLKIHVPTCLHKHLN